MKLFITIFLIISHLFSTVGFSMELHECGNQKSYSFYGVLLGSHCECDHDSVEHGDDCCNDKKIIVKPEHKDKQSNEIVVFQQMVFESELNFPIYFSENKIHYTNNISLAFGTKKPPNYSPPLYILYNVFLI